MGTLAQDLSQRSAEGAFSPPPSSSGRLLSVDVFRGLAVAGMILVDNPGDDTGAYWPIKHAEWNGWTPADLIFPSFLFLAGVSIVFSFRARLQRGESRQEILVHAIKRAIILFTLGLILNGIPTFHFSEWRIEGVLQRIAICYVLAAILTLWLDWRGQIAAIAICLAGYCAIMRFVPVPGFGVPGRDIPFLDPDRNLVAWLDRKLFMGRLYDTTRDPEGIISTIPAIAPCLFGVLAGQWLTSARPPQIKASRMLLAGILGLVAGEIWNFWFPINKNLWTSSFVVFAAGFSLVALALLYWALEVQRWRGAWTKPMLVFGTNAILGFIADALVYGPGYGFTAPGPNGIRIPLHEWANARLLALTGSIQSASLLYSVLAVVFCWILLWLLYRKRIFIRI
jgi:predicted acyltransferase